jgi:hypothetical protein
LVAATSASPLGFRQIGKAFFDALCVVVLGKSELVVVRSVDAVFTHVNFDGYITSLGDERLSERWKQFRFMRDIVPKCQSL